MKHVKKIVLLAVATFFIYAIFKSPGQAANIVQAAWDIVAQGVKSIGSFFNAILSHN